ncbi:MAG: C4-type zinc ribbon domain-containing protein [Bacteroidales bacterium]|nr:C4-type zinc ribbon domain-containing protein [Bacteroidales bacterium]
MATSKKSTKTSSKDKKEKEKKATLDTLSSAEIKKTEQVIQDPVEKAVINKLVALYTLQNIDTQIDKIRIIRGELPLEVQDLRDSIDGLKTRLNNFIEEISEKEKFINHNKQSIEQSRLLIEKYNEDLKKIRNNREYESISKEIEYQQLEIELFEKHIREAKSRIEQIKFEIEEVKKEIASKEEILVEKEAELQEIIKETEKEEKFLLELREKAWDNLDDRYKIAYQRIRSSVKNGLAVVKIERDACGGCFNKIPPQRQLEINMHKKIMICEYCGRILVDNEIAEKVKLDELLAAADKEA